MCLECTILGAFGLPLSNFKHQLFGLSSIQSYINQSKNIVLVVKFEYDEAQALSTSAAVPALSQLSQLSQMSQVSQMSQYAANPLEMGGYQFGMAYGVPLIQPYEHKAEIPMRFGSGTLGPDM
jgi:hypothetical protein